MNPCDEIKSENPLKLKCEDSYKNLNQKCCVSDQLIAIEKIFKNELFPHLEMYTSISIMKIGIGGSDARVVHNSLKDFFKRKVSIAKQENKICSHSLNMIIKQITKYMFSRDISNKLYCCISIEDYKQIETDFWNNFLENIKEANQENVTCLEPKLKLS